MALSREQVIDAAWAILQEYGLGDLSMRRLAKELGVQPGALYWHVANKQELLAALAQRMVVPLSALSWDDAAPATQRAALLIHGFRSAILTVRDGADVVSVAHALTPEDLEPVPLLTSTLTQPGVTEEAARAVALTLVRFALGSVTAQQTREAMGLDTTHADAEFTAGVGLLLD